jgi:hypothetical protein
VPPVVAPISPVFAALPPVSIPIVVIAAGVHGHGLRSDERCQKHSDDSRFDTVHVDLPPDGRD